MFWYRRKLQMFISHCSYLKLEYRSTDKVIALIGTVWAYLFGNTRKQHCQIAELPGIIYLSKIHITLEMKNNHY